MRLLVYFMITIAMLMVSSYWGQPLQAYLKTIKSEAVPNPHHHDIAILSVVKGDIASYVADSPTIARAQVALIHEAIMPDGNLALHWDVIATVATTGLTENQSAIAQWNDLPLTQWSDFLGTLLTHECAFVTTIAVKNGDAMARLRAAKTKAFLVCPIFNTKQRLLGALFVVWDDRANVPTDLTSLKGKLRTTAGVIGNTIKTDSRSG